MGLVMLGELLTAIVIVGGSPAPGVADPIDCAVDRWRGAVAIDRADELPDGWTYNIECGPSGDYHWGTTSSDDRTVTLWPAMAPTLDELEDLVWHELGHVALIEEVERVERFRWTRVRDLDWDDWHACAPDFPEGCTDGVEDFAEAFSHCQSHRDPERHWDHYGPVPDDHECDVVDSLTREWPETPS